MITENTLAKVWNGACKTRAINPAFVSCLKLHESIKDYID